MPNLILAASAGRKKHTGPAGTGGGGGGSGSETFDASNLYRRYQNDAKNYSVALYPRFFTSIVPDPRRAGKFITRISYTSNIPAPGVNEKDHYVDITYPPGYLKLGQDGWKRWDLELENPMDSTSTILRKLSYQFAQDYIGPDGEGWAVFCATIPVTQVGLNLRVAYGNYITAENPVTPVTSPVILEPAKRYRIKLRTKMETAFGANDGIIEFWVRERFNDGTFGPVIFVAAKYDVSWTQAEWRTCTTPWDSAHTYNHADVVKYGGNVYMARHDAPGANLNQPPPAVGVYSGYWFIVRESNFRMGHDETGNQEQADFPFDETRLVGDILYGSSDMGWGDATPDLPDTVAVPSRFAAHRWYDGSVEKAGWDMVAFDEHTNVHGLGGQAPVRLATISANDAIVNGTAQRAYIYGEGVACYAMGTPASANQSVTLIQQVMARDVNARYAHSAFVRRNEATDSHYAFWYDTSQFYTFQKRVAGVVSNVAFGYAIPTLSVGDILDFTFAVTTDGSGHAVLTLKNSTGTDLITPYTDASSPLLAAGTCGIQFNGRSEYDNPTGTGFSYMASAGVET